MRAAPEPSCRAPRATRPRPRCARCSSYIGDDPDREGLVETPKRFVNAYEELFGGYKECPAEMLDRTFSETGGYDEPVLVRDIPFYSHCEHHMMPFTGRAHIAYVPTGRVVGLSKIARLIDVYARRLQTQEHLTAQIATAIEEILQAAGRRRDARSRAHLHVDARRREAGLDDADDQVHRPVRGSAGAGALHHAWCAARADRWRSRVRRR